MHCDFASLEMGINMCNDNFTASDFEDVRKYVLGIKLIYTSGLTLLNNPVYLSQDDTHPSLEGIQEIAENWKTIMEKTMK